MAIMLGGEYKHQCDAKYRLRIPAKLKKELGENAVITKGNDGCLFLLPKSEMDNVLSKIENLSIFNSQLQKPLRFLFSSAVEIEEDNQGRFLLPASLREFAGITKDVVFVGVGNRAELWSEESWTKYCNDNSANFDDIISELGKNGI